MSKVVTDKKIIDELLTRGVDEVIVKNHLERRLKRGDKLRVKFGIDPTSPDLHLGHSVPLRKLRQFQDLGHQVIFLIGDFTAMIGDPSARTALRRPLTREQIRKNMRNYVKQAGKILDIKKIEVRYNSEWYDKKKADFIMEISSRFTIARLMERDDFKRRIKEDMDISMLEVTYPLLQGYDSVVLKADVEIGGTDQKFNLLMGRKVQKRYNQPQQDIITVPLLEGTDGVQKMSKTYNNWIGLTEKPDKIYGKVMSIPDARLWKYFGLLTNISSKEIEKMKADAKKAILNPRDAKVRLAREIVTIYHGKVAASKAEKEFNRVFKEHKIPTRVKSHKLREKNLDILTLLTKTKLAPSKAEAKRLVIQGGVKIDGKVVKDWKKDISIKPGRVLQVGKRRFIKLSS